MTLTDIASDLLRTYEGIENISLSDNSWFNVLNDTKEYYNLDEQEAKTAHSIALMMIS